MTTLPGRAGACAARRTAIWLAIALSCTYPLAFLLPPAWALENGAVENLQAAILACGCLLALAHARRSRIAADARMAAALVPVWAVLCGRELSWGAVFRAPTGFVDGVALYSSSALWYKPLVAPAILVAAAWVVATAWRHRLAAQARLTLRLQPACWSLLAAAAAAGALASCAEGHLGCALPLSGPRAMAWEELLELFAYGALLYAQYRAFHALGHDRAGAVTPLRSGG